MKPLRSAPLTSEDRRIWNLVSIRSGPYSILTIKALWDCAAQQDRRDAELMNWAQTIRRIRDGGYRMTAPLDDQVYAWQENVHHCGGDITRFV